MLKEHQFSNVKVYHGENSKFEGPGRKYYTEVHKIIPSFLVSAAPELIGTNLSLSSLLICVTPRNIYSRFISLRIICFTLSSRCIKKFSRTTSTKKEFCRAKTTG